MNDLLLLLASGLLLGGWAVFVFTLATRGDTLHGDTEGHGMCAPMRYDSLTGQPAAAPRRIVAELAPPAGWRDVHHIAIVPAPAAVWADDDLEPEDDGDELAPVAVPNWPKLKPVERPAVVEPEPVPVVVPVDWTAARFASLEVRR